MPGHRSGQHRFVALATVLAVLATTTSIATISATAQGVVLTAGWGWGDDEFGQLGIGDSQDCFTQGGDFCAPTQLDYEDADLRQIDGGNDHGIALDADGGVFNWGRGEVLAGTGGDSTSSPIYIGDPGDIFVAVVAGDEHSLALAEDGTVWSWGRNDSGQLGHGYIGSDPTEPDPEFPFVQTPAQVAIDVDVDVGVIPLDNVVAIAGGGAHSLALDAEGNVWAWGANFNGQLGNGNAEGSDPFARRVLVDNDVPLENATHIAAGRAHSLAVADFGETVVFGWGNNGLGQLGYINGSMETFATQGLVLVEPIAQIAGGDDHSLVLTEAGEILAAGGNESGQLGNGQIGQPNDGFGPVVELEEPTTIAARGEFSLAIQAGEVFAWGSNQLGQHGNGSSETAASATPLLVTGLPEAGGLGAGRFSGYAVTLAPEEDDYGLALFVDNGFEGEVGDIGDPGITRLDLSTVDIGTLPLFQGELASAPLRASPLRASPLRASPLRASPLRASPLRASPLRASPLRASPLRASDPDVTPLRASPLRASPLRASPLRASPLSELPLLLDGGWAQVLVGTPYQGVALQSVRFGDVLDLDPSPLDDLSLDDVDWSNSPMKRASIVGFLFGGLTLDQLGGAATFCSALPTGFCAEHGIVGTSTLLELDLAGAPLQDLTFLPAVQIEDIDWAAGTNTPAYYYDLMFVDVQASPIGAITLDQLPPGLVDCDASLLDSGIIDCSDPTNATLTQAVAAGAIPLYDLGDPNPAILGRILEDPNLVSAVTGPLTIGDVLPMIVDPAKLDYSSVSLLRLLAGQPVEGNLVTYIAEARLSCDEVTDFSMRVTVPPGFRYEPGSVNLDLDGGEQIGKLPEPLETGLPPDLGTGDEPTPQEQPLTFVFDDVIQCGDASSSFVRLSFDALPFVDLGSFPASLDLLIGADEAPTASVGPTAAYTVLDPFEGTLDGPLTVGPGTLYLGWLAEGDQADQYVVEFEGSTELEPGTMVTAVLSHLPADFDLRLDGPASAPLRASPLRASPLRASPLRASPIEDEGLSGDPAGQQVPSDKLQDVPTDDDTLSQSANRGTEADVVSTVVTASTAGEPLSLAVSSYLGSSSNQPYSLQVFVDPPPELNCDPVALDRVGAFAGGSIGGLPTLSSVAPDTRTLVLYNHQRLEALYGAPAVADLLDALGDLENDPEAKALLLPVDGSLDVRDAYGDWDADPCSPEAANDVVRSILEVTDPYVAALDHLRYVTIIGSDDIVPSARIPDLVTLSNQRDYYQELVFGGVDNPLSAAQAMSYVTSDSAYTDLDPIDWLGHQLLVPDLAGGRLVETPGEIIGAIDQYLGQPYVATDRSLVTAYDFLTHGGEDTQDTFEAIVGSTGAARSLISEDWDQQDLRDELQLDPNLIAINAHYDHSRSLPAIGDHVPIPSDELFTSTDLLGSLSGDGALYFTVGCNAGINVPALSGVGLPDGHERLLDWAQSVAQLPGSGFLGNTGFGYGDTEYSAYSERLMSLFATYLDGSMTVGQASVAARKAYIAERGLLGVYDDKVLTEATLYGLPFVRVGAAGTSAPADEVFDPFAGSPDTDPVATDAATGLEAAPFDLDVTHQLEETDRGDFYRVGDNLPLSVHYRPLQPSMQLALPEPAAGQAIGDVLITGLTSTTTALENPLFVRPTIDNSQFEPEPNIRNLGFPSTIGTLTPEASLIVLPGQYRGEDVASSTGQQILHTRVAGKVFYPPAGPGLPATGDPRPSFTRVDGLRQVNSVFFEVEVDPAEYVLVLYRQPGTSEWGSLELALDGDGLWRGSVSPQDQVLEFFVQAVSADGLVGAARGKGFDFVPTLGDIVAPTIDITVPAPGQTFAVDQVVSAQYTCADEDGGSGIAVCTAWDPDLEQPASDQLDTTPGVRSFSVYAKDTAGNEHVETVSYGAGYAFDGFFEPVKNPPVINQVKGGRGIPLKFRLSDANGLVTDTAVIEHIVVRASSVCGGGGPSDPVEDEPAASQAGLIYSSANEQFVFTWLTNKKDKGCFEVEVKTIDGATYLAWFRVT